MRSNSNVSFAVSTVAAATYRDSETVPSNSMKSNKRSPSKSSGPIRR